MFGNSRKTYDCTTIDSTNLSFSTHALFEGILNETFKNERNENERTKCVCKRQADQNVALRLKINVLLQQKQNFARKDYTKHQPKQQKVVIQKRSAIGCIAA